MKKWRLQISVAYHWWGKEVQVLCCSICDMFKYQTLGAVLVELCCVCRYTGWKSLFVQTPWVFSFQPAGRVWLNVSEIETISWSGSWNHQQTDGRVEFVVFGRVSCHHFNRFVGTSLAKAWRSMESSDTARHLKFRAQFALFVLQKLWTILPWIFALAAKALGGEISRRPG